MSPAQAAFAWLVAGILVAGLLHRHNQEPPVVVSAIVAWPLALPLLFAPTRGGPFALDILRATAVAEEALARHRAELPWLGSLDNLRERLQRADERIAAVDRSLEQLALVPESQRPDLTGLQVAREHAATQLLDILRRVGQLRVELELCALKDDDTAIRASVRELVTQMAALDQLRHELQDG